MTLKEFAIEIPALRDEAKARWGEGLPEAGADYYYDGPETNFEWHLQQMLISDDPVKYLKDHSGKEA